MPAKSTMAAEVEFKHQWMGNNVGAHRIIDGVLANNLKQRGTVSIVREFDPHSRVSQPDVAAESEDVALDQKKVKNKKFRRL